MSKVVYETDKAARVTHENLPQELREKYKESTIYTILEIDGILRNISSDIKGACANIGIFISQEELDEVFKAEEVYLRQIGAML